MLCTQEDGMYPIEAAAAVAVSNGSTGIVLQRAKGLTKNLWRSEEVKKMAHLFVVVGGSDNFSPWADVAQLGP